MACPRHLNNFECCGTLIKCPYIKEHHASPFHIVNHIFQCRQYHGNTELVKCDCNTKHFFPEAERTFHDKYCDNRGFQEIFRILYTKPATDSDTDDSSNISTADLSMDSMIEDQGHNFFLDDYCSEA